MSQPSAEDFNAVHAGVMETARGRWFLHEYSRRYRNADTTLLLTAIKRMESALSTQNAIPASGHEPVQLANQSPPPRANFEAVPFSHQLHELRDAIRLTKDSLPVVGAGHNAQTGPDFTRVAKAISVIAARMRWIAGQVPEAQKRAITTVHDDLDKLVDAASMIAALLAEIETQLDSLIDVAQALAEAEVLAATEPSSIGQAAAEPVSAAPPAPAPEPVQEAPAVAAMEITPAPEVIADVAAPQAATIETAVETAETPLEIPAAPAPQDMRWLETLAPQIVGRTPHDALVDAPVNFELAAEPYPVIAMPNPAWRENEHPGASSTPLPESPAPMPAALTPQAEPAKAPDIAAFELVQRLIEETVVEKITETIKETIQQTIIATLPEKIVAPAPAPHIVAPSWASDEPREDPGAFAFDPFSHGLQSEPQSVTPEPPAQAQEEVQPVQTMPSEQPAQLQEDVQPAQALPPAPVPHEQTKTADDTIKPLAAPSIQIAPIQIAKANSPLAPIMALSDEEKIALFS
jgi:hypothetical protein